MLTVEDLTPEKIKQTLQLQWLYYKPFIVPAILDFSSYLMKLILISFIVSLFIYMFSG